MTESQSHDESNHVPNLADSQVQANDYVIAKLHQDFSMFENPPTT